MRVVKWVLVVFLGSMTTGVDLFAGDGDVPMRLQLRDRAEAPGQPRVADRADHLDAVGGDLLFSMTGADNAACVRGVPDVNGDGLDDVIAGSFDLHAYAMSGSDGEILWSFDTGNRVFSIAPVGDLDGDGGPEVVVGTQDTSSNVVVYVLDGGDGGSFFSDGFEDGGTTAWSVVTP